MTGVADHAGTGVLPAEACRMLAMTKVIEIEASSML